MTFLENPWKMAEDAVFKALVTATGAEAKKNAFQGFLPPAGNVWALKVGGGGDVRNTWTAPITELRMDADIESIFLERARAQEFALKILKALPITRISNVQCFRLRTGGMPDIRFKEVTMANETHPRMVWTASIGCEIVFNTVERPNVETVT
jgi:hypothetical protein